MTTNAYGMRVARCSLSMTIKYPDTIVQLSPSMEMQFPFFANTYRISFSHSSLAYAARVSVRVSSFFSSKESCFSSEEEVSWERPT